MIKKLLLLILILAVGYSAWVVYTDGFSTTLGSNDIEVYSYARMIEANDELDGKIEELESINNQKHGQAQSKLTDSKSRFESEKQQYDLLTNEASEEEIAEANKKEEYLLDFLWIKIGNYAEDNNLKIKMQPLENNTEITFDISGSYISITNFMYDIQNDKELGFNIDSMTIEGGSTSSTVNANFKVVGINVVTEASQI